MKVASENGGVGCLGVIAIVLITLKLVGVLAWSWVWVLLPIWGPFAVALFGLGAIILVYAIIGGDRRD